MKKKFNADKSMKVGDRYTFSWADFDGCGEMEVEVTEIHEDYAIAVPVEKERADEHYWIDEDTIFMFTKI